MVKLRKDDYDRFVDVFNKRYRNMIKTDRKPTVDEMMFLYAQFKASRKTADQWFTEREQA